MIITFKIKAARMNESQLVSTLRNKYWQIRAIRPGQSAKRRKLYREIQTVKAELLKKGADETELHHYGRSLASHKTTNARTATKKHQETIEKMKSEGKTPLTDRY